MMAVSIYLHIRQQDRVWRVRHQTVAKIGPRVLQGLCAGHLERLLVSVTPDNCSSCSTPLIIPAAGTGKTMASSFYLLSGRWLMLSTAHLVVGSQANQHFQLRQTSFSEYRQPRSFKFMYHIHSIIHQLSVLRQYGSLRLNFWH
jgi:hypothetical protein